MMNIEARLDLIEKPPPEENSLRWFLSAKFQDGMTEELIAVALNQILLRLQFVHQEIGAHRHIDSTLIGVYWGAFGVPTRIGLSHRTTTYLENLMHSPDPDGHQKDIRSVGIVALEMAYGSLPNGISNQQLNEMAANLVRILRPKFQRPGKETIKRMPDRLEKLLDNEFVDRRQRKLQIKATGNVLEKTEVYLGDLKNLGSSQHPDGSRTFSRGFLQVVLKLLDRNPPAPLNEILELSFIQKNSGTDFVEAMLRV